MNMIKTELGKQKKRIFLLCIIFPLLLNGLLFVDLQYRYEGYLLIHQSEYGLSNWQLIFKEQTIFYFSELCHVIAAVIVYEAFSVELKHNAWLIAASTSYRKYKVVLGKYMVSMIAGILFFLMDYISLYVIGKNIGVAGAFEASLFVKSFFIQLSAFSMMSAFYIFLVSLLKRIAYLIPVSLVFLILNVVLYYREQVSFQTIYPFTYISHCFRATAAETVVSILVSVVFSGGLLGLSTYVFRKNYDIR